jgi:hypothetical protein
LVGKVPTLVSSNLIRVLFSFIRIVSKPKLSLLTQSKPKQPLPWTIRSSGMTWSAAVTLRTEPADFADFGPWGSLPSGITMDPASTTNPPETTGLSGSWARSRAISASSPLLRASARALRSDESIRASRRSS